MPTQEGWKTRCAGLIGCTIPRGCNRVLATQLGKRIGLDDLSANHIAVRMRGAALLLHPDLASIASILKGLWP
ncbi:hypothetical protein OS190_07675 [Sulfitobacter sp. F26204]|uniref:hypothetical protein n=1 Tax=Sulfitobacter sp. F26204 TaxID=2996014 RepID=UPI00225DE342|nr:hypothetical protein [Sulfitobacter sp. F26204]MCX7559447.1 hypothetical protein [Sulfitobacter sp. F26204]